MKQMLMGIALLAVGVFFNPPKFLESFSLFMPEAIAKSSSKDQKSIVSGRIPNFKIVINIPATELRFFEDEDLLRRIPIAVGQAIYPTPSNKVDRLSYIVWNPWWNPPDSEWARDAKPTPPGPGNPLGVVKMPLSNAVLLHGTDKPWSIGTPASHACIRMYNEDARSLAWTLQSHMTPYFDEDLLDQYAKEYWKSVQIQLPRSIPVYFIYEPIEVEDGEVNLHRDLYSRIRNKKEAIVATMMKQGFQHEEIDMKKLDKIVNEWRAAKTKVSFDVDDLVK